MSLVALECLLLLLLVTGSFSLYITEDGSTTCTNSSLIMMSQSQIKRNNGSFLVINDLFSTTSKCSTTNAEKQVYVAMGDIKLEHKFTDNSNTTLMVRHRICTSKMLVLLVCLICKY